MPTLTDQTGYDVNVPDEVQRIVSLVPSQSELLWDLGLAGKLAGITKFCIHPEEMFRTIPRVGGTKTLKLDAIRSLRPDLVLANKEENERMQIEELRESCPVWTSDISDLGDSLEMIREVGMMTKTMDAAYDLMGKIGDAFSVIGPLPLGKKRRAAYVIWNDPIMLAAPGSFIDDMMTRCGFINVCPTGQGRYPSVTTEGLRALRPELILLSSEPFPFKEKHLPEWQERFPEIKSVLVDGELFSWYGSRLLHSPEYFKGLRAMLLQE
ncbi:MAG: ABC transporter substrate-binding protein [Flavobacteriales bacterium]|nr:ABC transporter substrate-binding protein [Flavobacteriales bacterium]